MNKKHYIIIQESIIEDIEEVMKLPDEYKSKIKELCLSNDLLNVSLVNEILDTLYNNNNIILIRDLTTIFNNSFIVKDPSRYATLILK